MVSKQVLRKRHQPLLDELEEGDIVEFDRGVYKHWGVYVGEEEVIHRASPDDIASSTAVNPSHLSSCSGVIFSKASVRKDKLIDVAGKDKARRNNALDNELRPLPGKEIVKKALAREGEVGYNLLTNNCEHFATECRYGKPKSEQVSFWSKVGTGVIAAVVIGVVAWFFSK